MTKLIEVKNLKKYFPIRRGIFRSTVGNIKAVDNISFSVGHKEVVGLVGGSGSGKTTAGLATIRLIEPTEGEIRFLGEDFRKASPKQLRRLRQKVQMVFQDPLASLNPRKTILENVGEALLFHKSVHTRSEQIDHVVKILQKVSIHPSALNQYPHQFSGGQQQRISIGRALILRPKLIVCDEVTSALDLSIQAQVLNLLNELKKSDGLSYLFISHDLSVVRHLCDRILVMHQGKIVEEGVTEAIFEDPKHSYTKQLLKATPIRHPRERLNTKLKSSI
ncbi:MAG: Oligopeptide transport ATP-binding protein OppF [Chlamydiales bacterium]|nr:Oligopeptide transport ATP-binding protein OppF [Chlamydiales bacterium]